MTRVRYRRGMVLVFALWALSILTILAVSVAAGIRQKIFLVQRLDERSRMNYLLQSAVKKAAGYIHQQMEESSFIFIPQVKMNLLNNSNELSSVMLGRDQAGIGYVSGDGKSVRWGVVDEESKINLNKTDLITLTNLIMDVLQMREEDASKLALSLMDWRKYGEGEISGFFTDDYYTNLQYPYPKKSADYETLDEILLVKGISRQVYDRLINFVTIYGDGLVNINTAPREVLMALGLPGALADKVLSARRGKDAVDGTPDDHIFLKTYEITFEVNAIVPLTLDETRVLDALNMKGAVTTNSFYYTIEATGRLAGKSTTKSVRAVYSSRDDKILYWKER